MFLMKATTALSDDCIEDCDVDISASLFGYFQSNFNLFASALLLLKQQLLFKQQRVKFTSFPDASPSQQQA